MIYRLLFTAVLALFVGSASAQSVEGGMRAKLLTLALDDWVDGVYYVNKGKPALFTASLSGFGTGIDYVGGQVLSLYKSEEELKELKGDSPPAPLASVKLPTGHERILLFVSKDKEGKIVMKANGLSLKGFRGGDYRFYNMSGEKVALIMGDKKVGLKPNGVETLSSNDWKDKVKGIPIKLGQFSKGNEVKMVYNTVWGHFPSRRTMVLVLKGPSSSSPFLVKKLYDMAETEPEE